MSAPLFDPAHAPAATVLLALADAAVKSAALLVLAAAGSLLLRKSSAAARHALWCGALAGALVLPALSIMLPAWWVPWLPEWEAAGKATEATEGRSQIIGIPQEPGRNNPTTADQPLANPSVASPQLETRNSKLHY